ncbi:putative phage protein [Escherichia coli]|nr:putative phage protein [Escherichia coli]
MTTITKERLLTIKQWRETYGPGSNVVLPAEEAEELARIALASLEAEKVTLYRERNPYNGMTTGWQELTEQEYEFVKDNASENAEFRTVYTAPPVPVVPAALPENDDEDGHDIDYLEPSEVYALGRTAGWNACRAAMLQSNQPVSQTYNLPELIEGMEVSIDVSTCDADLGNRYFGTVTEALELDTAKNGYILLVQDAEPNFDVNGNSPVTQDGWISCSERMPEIRQTVIGWNGYAVRQCVYTRNEYAKTQKGREPRFETLTGIWHGVTHWMPLPEPPQEVN